MEWKSAHKELPETEDYFLCIGYRYGYFIAKHYLGDNEKQWFDQRGIPRKVKYWQELPPIPKE